MRGLSLLPLEAGEPPVVFARSGQKATLPVGGDTEKTGDSVALWAFGRQWAGPLTVKNGAAELQAPTVRVPVVFQLGPVRDRKVVFSELVVYPDRPVAWDKDTPVAAAGIPDWFDTWSAAVGLPLHKVNELASLDAGNWRTPDKPGLLLLGRKAAGTPGHGPAAICRFAAEHKINVLVLEADWFGVEKAAGPPVGHPVPWVRVARRPFHPSR